MGRGYALKVVRAKMLYDERAIETGALALRQDPPITGRGDELGRSTLSRLVGSVGLF